MTSYVTAPRAVLGAVLRLKPHVIACGLLVLLATFLMAPRLASPRFGLLDDGVALHVSRAILESADAGDLTLIFRLERDRGRFRPVYWAYYAGQYAIWGANPLGFFVGHWLSFVLTSLLVYGCVAVATNDRRASLFSGLAYLLSPPVVESYYTLSKPEPPLALWLAASLFFLVHSRATTVSNLGRRRGLFAASAFFVLLAYFTKETAHAMLLVSGLWMVHRLGAGPAPRDQADFDLLRRYFVANLLIVGLYWGAHWVFGIAAIPAGEDSRHYALTADRMFSGLLKHVAWYLRDFPFLVPVTAFFVVIRRRGSDILASMRTPLVASAALWLVAWTVVMLPWHSTLEYYLLPACIGAAIISGIGLSAASRCIADSHRATRLISKSALICAVVLTPCVLANALTTGRIQVAVDWSNSRLIDYLALNVPGHGTVLVNLPEPNEYVGEIGAHLAVLKERRDITVGHLDSLEGELGSGIFVVTPLIKNQPLPTVRTALYESGANTRNAELHARFARGAKRVYHEVQRVPLLLLALDEPACPLLIRAGILDGVYCGARRPILDTRIFEYGWEVYEAALP